MIEQIPEEEVCKGVEFEKLPNGDLKIIGFRLLQREFIIKKPGIEND